MAGLKMPTNAGVTDLLIAQAILLFPKDETDRRYIEIAVDPSGNVYNARFLGFGDFNEAEWKAYLLPHFAVYKWTPNALYQILLKPAQAHVQRVDEVSLEGTVTMSGMAFSLVEVVKGSQKYTVAVPGSLDIGAPIKLVRREFLEVDQAPAFQGYASAADPQAMSQPGQGYPQAPQQAYPATSPDPDLSRSDPGQTYPHPFLGYSPSVDDSQLHQASSDYSQGFSCTALSTLPDPIRGSDSPYRVIDVNALGNRFEYQVDVSHIDVEEYPSTCGERRLPILSLKNTGKWNSDLQQSVDKLAAKYSHWRRSRGDGNCYYRAVAVSYLEHLARWSTVPMEMHDFYTKLYRQEIQITPEFAPYVRYFLKKLYDLYQVKSQGSALPALQQLFKDPLFDQSAVGTFRCIARAALMKFPSDPEFSSFFTMSTGIGTLMKQIETMGNEAEGLTFMAMAKALNAKIIHWTVSGAQCRNDDFNATSNGTRKLVIHLLLKPGHYDVLYPLGAQLLDNYSYEADSLHEDCKGYNEVQDLLVW